MARWSIANRILPVSYDEFTTLTDQFKDAVEKSFGTECRIEITALSAHKHASSFWYPDEQAELDRINEANTIHTPETDKIDREIWDRARYVEVAIRPVNEKLAPRLAFAHAEFKGIKPLQATFYVQPDGEDIRDTMLEQKNLTQKIGGGFDSNSILNGRRPTTLRGILRNMF